MPFSFMFFCFLIYKKTYFLAYLWFLRTCCWSLIMTFMLLTGNSMKFMKNLCFHSLHVFLYPFHTMYMFLNLCRCYCNKISLEFNKRMKMCSDWLIPTEEHLYVKQIQPQEHASFRRKERSFLPINLLNWSQNFTVGVLSIESDCLPSIKGLRL